MAGYDDIVAQMQADQDSRGRPNPYDAAADQLRQEAEQTGARAALAAGMSAGQNADQAAVHARLAKRYGTSPDVVARFPEEFKQRMALEDARTAMTGAPRLQTRLAGAPAEAALVHDDLPNAAAIEQTATAPRPTPISSAIGDLLGEANRAFGAAVSPAFSLAARAAGAPLAGFDALAGTHAADAPFSVARWFDEYAQRFPTDTHGGFIKRLAQTAGSTLGLVSQAMATGGAAPAAAGPGATTLQALLPPVRHGVQAMLVPSSVASHDVAQKVLEQGGSLNDATRAGVASYLTNTLGGVVPFATPGRLAMRVGSGATMGVLTADVSRDLMNAALPDSMQLPAPTAEDRSLDALVGAIFGGLAGPRSAAHDLIRQTHQAAQAEQDAAQLTALGQLSAASKWRERDPEGFRSYVESVTEDGQLANVYVAGKAFAQALERAGVTPEELAGKLPEVAAQLTEAQHTGADVRIPTADYATSIAGGKLDEQLLQHLKTDPAGKTFAEAQAFYQGQAEAMKDTAARLVQDKQQQDAFRESQAQVLQQVHQQLDALGRMPSGVNKVNATVTTAILSRLAAAEGITPAQSFEKYGPRLLAQETGPGFDQRTVQVDGTRHPIENANGQPIARGFAEQQNFWKWFAGSQMADESGRPLVLYHGTGRDFTSFDRNAEKATTHPSNELGSFFTALDDLAGTYAMTAGGEAHVMPVYVRLENPARFADPLAWYAEAERRSAEPDGMARWRQELQAAGHDGMVVGHNEEVVAFGPTQVKSATGNRGTYDGADANILHQGEAAPRGAYAPDERAITLLKDANLSTYLHETGHWALDMYSRIAAEAGAPELIRADMDKVLKWFGVESLEQWHGMTLGQQRPFHEKFARGFEAYLMEGKAPSQELQPFFSRIKAWMVSIYRELRALDVQLTTEVRGVFDRMLASEEAIAEAQAARVFEPLFVDKPAGMTAQEWADYQDLGQRATGEAVEEMQRRSLRDMKWLSGAKARALKDLQKQSDAARKDVRAEVERDVLEEPVYQMQDWLKANKVKADKVDPDALAERFGFQSGEEALRALAEAPPRAEVIEGLTDRYMLERHGELSSPDAIDRAASEAVHNEARARFVATGLKVLTEAPVSARELVRGAREAAEAAVAGRRIRDLNARQYEAAETRANREALKLAAKDPAGAVQAQRASLLNNQLVRATQQALRDVDKALAHFKRLETSSAQSKMRGELLEQLNELLARFDLRTSAAKQDRLPLAAWVDKTASELSAVVPDLPAWVTNDAYRVHYRDLTVEQLRGLRDTVSQLEHLARREQKQYMAIRAMEFADERGQLLAEIRKTWPQAFDAEGAPKGVEPDFVPSLRKAVGKLGDKFAGEFLNPETIISILGGGKFTVLNESLFGRLSARSDWKAERLAGVFKEMKPLFDQYSAVEKFNFGRRDISTAAGLPVALTRENALVVALLHGNADGRERLANYGWNEAMQQRIVGLLDARDLKLANAIWRLFDADLWPELKALNERTRGKAPPKVEAVPFATPAGAATGGYFRLKYDTALDERAHNLDEGQAVKELLGGGFGMSARTNQGASTERKDNVRLRPRLDLGVFAEAVNETVHDLAYREAVADTMRMLNDKGLQQAVKQVVGTEGYRALVTRVREVAAPPRNPAGFVENAISVARRNTIVNLMSGVKTALQNLTGLAPALAEINAGTLGGELARFYSPQMVERYQFAMEQSAYMRQRFTHYDRDLQTGIRQLTVKNSLRPDESTFLALMGFVDKGVAVPVWNAAFKQGMGRFDHDVAKSVDYADHIVRQTQGSGRDVDLARIMSGHGGWGQLKKAFTMFYGYFNGQLNLLVKHGVVTSLEARENPQAAAAKAAAKLVAIVAVPTVLTELLMHGGRQDGESDEDQRRRFAGAFVKYGAGFVPFVRDLVPGIWAVLTGDHYFGTKISPLDSAAEGVVRAAKSAADVAKGEGDEKDTKNLIMGLGYLVGAPGKLIADTVDGTRAWLRGEAGPQAILLGPPKK